MITSQSFNILRKVVKNFYTWYILTLIPDIYLHLYLIYTWWWRGQGCLYLQGPVVPYSQINQQTLCRNLVNIQLTYNQNFTWVLQYAKCVANLSENSEANLIHRHYRFTAKNALINFFRTKYHILKY